MDLALMLHIHCVAGFTGEVVQQILKTLIKVDFQKFSHIFVKASYNLISVLEIFLKYLADSLSSQPKGFAHTPSFNLHCPCNYCCGKTCAKINCNNPFFIFKQ